MDRCPTCRGPLEFFGVQTKHAWMRWLMCTVCGRYTATDSTGMPLVSGQVAEPDPKRELIWTFRGKSD